MYQRRQWHLTPVLLPGKSHGRRILVGCSPWGRWGSDTTEQLHFHFSLSCIGEGNGSPLQCSCLENPRDGGAWWAAVYGVAQSWTRLKRRSSSSSRVCVHSKFLIYLCPTSLSILFGNHKFVFKVCESISVLLINSFVSLFLDSTCKWNHMIFVFLWLTSFTMTISRSIHVLLRALFHSFFNGFFYCWV